MATSVYAYTEGTTNAKRVRKLLAGPCTDGLRDVFRHHVPPSTFPQVIAKKKSNLPHMTAQQRNFILPRGSSYAGNYDDMDIPLLYTLLRNIGNIPPHSKGWGNDPDPNDRSLSASIERICIARNQFGPQSRAVFSNADFNTIWSTIKSAVADLDVFLNNENQYEKKVEFLRHETMDLVRDRHYIEELRKQIEEDEATRERVHGPRLAETIPPERFMAYIKNGMTKVRHARGIVVGCAGAGKTTLLYRLMGKSLYEIKDIKSTRGLHVYEHIFFVRNGDLFATENVKRRLIRIPISALEKNKQCGEEESLNDHVGRKSGSSASLEGIQIDMKAGKELKASQSTTPKRNETNDQQLAQDVMREILDARETEPSVSMLDFAGQFAYYACHQIYMRSKAFYILVLDMSKDFQNVVKSKADERQGSIFSKWCYKDYLYFWLDSIKSFGGTSAQVLAVATHAEDKDTKERNCFWKSLWRLLSKEDKTWFHKSLSDREFTLGLIDMNEDGNLSLQSLKNSIADVVSQGMDTTIEVPSAWALLEHLLQKTEKPILSIDDINAVNKKLPDEYQLRSQEEISDFLSFFHGHGLLLFFKEDGLRTHAIFGIQWFSNAFSKLIADEDHIDRACERKYIEEWECFNATGNLSNSLVDALWKEERSYGKHKNVLMSCMERLRMLVSIDNTDGEISWYVPCMNKKPFTHDVFKQNQERSSILCFRFTSFAMFVYYGLIAHCMSFLKWNVPSDENGSQCLYQTAAIFETERNHTVIVGIFENEIQVQVLRIKNLQPRDSCYIGKKIELALTELAKTLDEMKNFQKGYKCRNIFCSKNDVTFNPPQKMFGIQCSCPVEEKHEIMESG